MKDAVLAGVLSNFESYKIKDKQYELYSGNQIYLNTGVLLYNLKNWRQKNCYGLMEEVLRKKKRLKWPDQTLINNAIPEKWIRLLPRKYNYTTHYFHENQEAKWMMLGGFHTKQEIEEAIRHPVIIHYLGGSMSRPWYEKSVSRRKNEYYRYKALSPWKDTPLMPGGELAPSKQFPANLDYWLLKQQIYRKSYLFVRMMVAVRNAIVLIARKYFNVPSPPSEGKEKEDNA